MSIEIICREVSRIMRKYDEPDPWKLAEAMGIIVQVMPLGRTEKSCKGFFLRQSRKKHITINSDLPEPIQRIILAHEIGHAVLHHEAAKMRAFHDFALYDTSSQMEYEKSMCLGVSKGHRGCANIRTKFKVYSISGIIRIAEGSIIYA